VLNVLKQHELSCFGKNVRRQTELSGERFGVQKALDCTERPI